MRLISRRWWKFPQISWLKIKISKNWDTDERAMITMTLTSSCHWKTLLSFCLRKKRPEKVFSIQWIIAKSCRKKNYATQNNSKLKDWHFSTNSFKGLLYPISLKNKIYKYFSSISKNMYIDKLDEILNKYSNTYHRTIKMKPVDVKPSIYIDFNKVINDKDTWW